MPNAPDPCEFHGQHPRIDERLDQLEERAGKWDGQIEELRRAASGVREEIAGMRGELRGALWASRMGGAVIGSLLALVSSGAIALLVYLLNRHGG